MTAKVKKWLGPQQACDCCNNGLRAYDTFYDALHRPSGRWALMCRACWQHHGAGVGQGVGQEYRSSDNIKLRG